MEIKKNKQIFEAIIDGGKCLNKMETLNEIGKAFIFPDYYGHNLDALEECLNDLSWLDADNYSLIINNYSKFLSDEDEELKEQFKNIFNDAIHDWANVPNFDGEEEYRNKSIFTIEYIG